MRRTSGVRMLSVAAVVVVALLSGGCRGSSDEEAQATPIQASDDLSFEVFISPRPSASPTATPSPVPLGLGSSSSGGSGSRSGGGSGSGSQAPSGPVSCPSGRVTATLTEYSASKDTSRNGDVRWVVSASGTVFNSTSKSVRDIRIEVEVHANNAEAESEGITLSNAVGSGSSSTWHVSFEYESEEEPDEDNVRTIVQGWSWGDPALAKCPTPGSSS